ncbi:MAG TPA: SDR family oxidoreductase [Edaphocola sp.]|nr:SDR family oxidoreductase [Edaphocola sp.]
MSTETRKVRPAQTQAKPGKETDMTPVPESNPEHFQNHQKLKGKVTIISGGDSGIGKATAKLFAREGSDIVIVYLNENDDALETKHEIERSGRRCRVIAADLSNEQNCENVVETTMNAFGRIDILINNAAVHWEIDDIGNISSEQLMRTFATNFYSCFWMTKYTVPHLKPGSSIINTTSVTAFRGSPHLMDYAASKGAILSFTRSLAINLIKKGIRVNAVAPGPVWTPLIASSLSPKEVSKFGSDTPMGRAGQPNEIAPCFLFLASDDAVYIAGQVLHPNGGEIVA